MDSSRPSAAGSDRFGRRRRGRKKKGKEEREAEEGSHRIQRIQVHLHEVCLWSGSQQTSQENDEGGEDKNEDGNQ